MKYSNFSLICYCSVNKLGKQSASKTNHLKRPIGYRFAISWLLCFEAWTEERTSLKLGWEYKAASSFERYILRDLAVHCFRIVRCFKGTNKFFIDEVVNKLSTITYFSYFLRVSNGKALCLKIHVKSFVLFTIIFLIKLLSSFISSKQL